jgi:hypothetical protein
MVIFSTQQLLRLLYANRHDCLAQGEVQRLTPQSRPRHHRLRQQTKQPPLLHFTLPP